jgi:hypothetical protein
MRFAKTTIEGEEGIIESTLVMIPLLALFLLTLEIIIAINFRNIDLTVTQSDASTRAISSVVSSDDEVLNFKSGHSSDSLHVLVTHKRRTLPRLVPKFILPGDTGNHSLEVTGFAVMEESR